MHLFVSQHSLRCEILSSHDKISYRIIMTVFADPHFVVILKHPGQCPLVTSLSPHLAPETRQYNFIFGLKPNLLISLQSLSQH